MRFCLSIAASLCLLSAARGEDYFKLPPGHVAVYEGTVKIKQSTGGDVSNEAAFKATLVCRAREVSPGNLQVLALRVLKPAEGEEAPLVAFDDAAVKTSGAGFVFEAALEPTPEEEESLQQLGVYFPLELLPAFGAPAAGSEARSDVEVSVLGLAKTKAAFVATSRMDGVRVEVTRKLAPDAKTSFDFRGDKASLAAWSETYSADAAGGLPSRIEKTVAMEVELGDGKLRFEKSLLLEVRKRTQPSGGEAAALDEVEKELRGLDADFGALKAPDDIAKRVEAFGKVAKGTAFEPAIDALGIRVRAYRALGLGKLAPDFTLESLDGKQVSFRAATKGKVTLLSFWGVG